MASLQAPLTEQEGDAICLDVAGLTDSSEVFRRIIVGNPPRDNVMNGKSSGRVSAALGTPIAIALQDGATQPEPSMCAKALSYRVPALFPKKGTVLVAAGIRACLGLRNPRPDDFIGRTADHALDSDLVRCYARTFVGTKTRSPFRCARESIEWLLAGVANQMHGTAAAYVSAGMGAILSTPPRHGLLEDRERPSAVSAFLCDVGFRHGAGHRLIIA